MVPSTGSFAADSKSDVTAAYATWDAAFNKSDAKAVAAPSAERDAAPANPRGGVGSGSDREVLGRLHANGVTNHKLEVIDAGGDDKVLCGTANLSAKGKDKDGKPANLSGIATHVFERQADNSLKLRLHTVN